MTGPVSVFQGLSQDATLKVLKPTDVLLRATNSAAQFTAAGTTVILQWDMAGFASFAIQLTGDSSSYAVNGSNDLDQWVPLDVRALGKWDAPVGTNFFQDNNAPTLIVGNKQTRFVRINSVTSSSRPTGILVLLSQQPQVPMRAARYSQPDFAWTYVPPSGGIVNTTPVTLKAAVNAFQRNLLTGVQLSNGGATGTELILTDSVSGVIWRGYLPPASTRDVHFDPPLRLAPNAALTATLTAASGAQVYVNAQGTLGLA